jgi:UDP-N-acetylglucosamine--N-acetylmuramyl-(pentapeptide) pyrophosphoryl-undecaprenol N-acetylglucosamine transferase
VANLKTLEEKGYQLLWQTGRLDFKDLNKDNAIDQHCTQIQLKEFIQDMATAYSAADVIVSRAGAIAISELAVAGKPVLLVPFLLQQKIIKPKMHKHWSMKMLPKW